MSRTSGIFTESSGRNCRLCRKNHDYYYNIFTSNVACDIAVKDAIHDLVGLHVAVGDGLPTTMCPLCLKKLTEFSVFKKICLESDAVLRKSLQSNCCRSFEGGGAADDNSGHSVETKGCTQDVIENNSQPTCSAQTTEIYLPVPDFVLPRVNELFHVKDEDEGNYPVLHTSDPTGISTDVSDPLATDELALKVGVEADGSEGDLPKKQQSQEEDEEESFCPMLERDWDEGDECRNSDAGTKVIIKEEEAANDSAGSSAGTIECVRDTIQETSQFACSVQMTEIYIPVQDCQLPRANIVLNEEEENEEILNEESYAAFNSPTAVGTSSDAVDPLEVDDEHMFTEDKKVIGNSEMTNDSMTEAIGLSTPDQVLVETTPTSHLLAERNVWIDLNDDCIGSSAAVTHIQSKTVASPCWDGMNSKDKDLKEGIAHHADKVLSNSIPDDGHSYMKHIPASRNSGNGTTMTLVGGTRDAPNITDSLRLIRVSEYRRSGIEAVMENKKEMSYCFIKNPRNGKNSNEKLYYCSHCKHGFNTNDDLLKHMEIHSGNSSLDPNDESSMGKDESFTVPASTEESNNSCESEALKRKRRGAMQKVNVPVLEICGGMGERKTAERVGSSDGDGKPYTQNMSSESTTSCATNLQNYAVGGAKGGPFNCSVCNKSFPCRRGLSNHMRSHKERKCYPCTICSKSFTSKSRITKHLRTHTDEKPYSCSDCMKSFSFKGNLITHLRTHTGEKPFSCNYCAMAFASKVKLIKHSRVHTGEKPFSCNYCAKAFSIKDNLIRHLHLHTGEKPFSCNYCTKTFTRKGQLVEHLRVHTGEKPFSCNYCSKAYTRKKNLVQHMHMHTGEKPFLCNYCAKTFARKDKLVEHSRVHTGEKPFSCNYCAKTFARKEQLIQHRHTHT